MISTAKGPSRKEMALVKRLQSIKDEIKRYPTPIAGCDEQFDFLLSKQRRLTLKLTEVGRSRERREDLKETTYV
jgi:hypothetical protein